MSHAMIVFLVEEHDQESAEWAVRDYVERIHDWWDMGEIVEKSDHFNKPLSECLEFIPQIDHVRLARATLKEAEESVAKENYRSGGYKYRMAGILFEQNLSYDYPMWNLTLENYSIPEKTEGWFAIETDLHY